MNAAQQDAVTQINVELGARSYPIWIGTGLLGAGERWRAALPGRHVLVVSNETVAPLYLERVLRGLGDAAFSTLILPDGEAHKTLDCAARIFAALAQLKASRDACVIALGGGVIGDLAGFAAACWMRGIAYVQMPTSLLAMVDSSVGGKTGVNLVHGKNLVGAFHQPRAVVIDTDALATLPVRELHAGLAEVVKYGALGDADFFAWLEHNADALLARESTAIAHAIATCCRQKAAIVARDEFEGGERALLNFGHTFGHALEAASGYGNLLHGEGVSIGMLLAAQLSARLGRAPIADAERLAALLARLRLPIKVPSGIDADTLLALMQLDKKNQSGRLRLILWKGVGAAQMVADVAGEDIVQVVRAGS
jgi:3-dehydroquinate synthase